MAKGVRRPGGLSSSTEPVPVSALRASIPDAQSWSLEYPAGDKEMTVSYDLNAAYFSDCVRVNQYDSDSFEIQVEHHNLRWLAARLLDAAQAIEARRAETQSGSVHESAVGEADAPEQGQSS